jgi:DNA adenine methylase
LHTKNSNNMTLAINSPFRYAGGKFYARKLILEHLTPHSTYIEPFAGGGSIFFAKPKANKNWLNDIDDDLINCYQFIKKFPHELIASLKGEEALKERHVYYKNEFKPKNDLERAQRWFYLNRTSYSGIMNMKNCYWGYGDKYSMRPENWGNNILRTSLKLKDVDLTQLDFEAVLDNIEAKDNAFLFIDPPYFNADQDKFYNCYFEKSDHFRLSEALKRNAHKFKFLLTYDNSEEIREMYEWADNILEREWNYTINRTDDQSKEGKANDKKKGERYKGKEIFILNYNSPMNKVISLFEEEYA